MVIHSLVLVAELVDIRTIYNYSVPSCGLLNLIDFSLSH